MNHRTRTPLVPPAVRAFVASLAVLAALPVSAGCRGRAKSAIDWQTKVPHAHGTALMHVPASCPAGHLYVDLQAVLANEATAATAEIVGEKLGAEMTDTPAEREGLRALRAAFKREGIELLRDVREIALCFRGDTGGLVAVVSGELSGKDVLGAIRRATAEQGDEPPELRVAAGVPYVQLGRVAVGRPAANVIVLGDDPALIGTLKTPTDRAAAWGATPGRILVARQHGDLDAEIAVSDQGDDVVIEGRMPFSKTKDVLEGVRDRAAARLVDTPLAILSDPVRSMSVDVEGGRALLVVRAKSSLIADAIRRMTQLGPGDFKKILGYVLAPDTQEQKI